MLLPFFICNVLVGWSPDMVNGDLFLFTVYLGWANSAFNPVIYSVFNKQYRRAFERILGCRKHNTEDISASSYSCRTTPAIYTPSYTTHHQVMKRKSTEKPCPPAPVVEPDETNNIELKTSKKSLENPPPPETVLEKKKTNNSLSAKSAICICSTDI